MNAISLVTVSLPEYTVAQEPDYRAIGGKLDQGIEAHFPPGQWLAVRGIGLCDHPAHSLDTLVATIREWGTDLYDPQRVGVHAEAYQNLTIHLHAIPCVVTAQGLRSPHYDGGGSGTVMGEVVSDFYGGTLYDRGYAIRLDVLMLYALEELEPVGMEETPAGWRPSRVRPSPTESCAFTFKNPDRKQDALRGIIQILR